MVVLIIFLVILQTVIHVIMLSIGGWGEGRTQTARPSQTINKKNQHTQKRNSTHTNAMYK